MVVDGDSRRRKMRETTKAYRRRKGDPFWDEVFVGDGVDVGSGDDPFHKEWFSGVRSVRLFDKNDGDAQYFCRYVRPASMDFVHASNCLEHLSSPVEALKNWLHVVKPGGHVVFTVPDEDLYEQGVFPSRWNAEHKATFTLFKNCSWSSRSVSLAKMLAELPACRVRRIGLADAGYDRSLKGKDQTMSGAEAFWEVVLGKLAVEVKPRTFKHSGARGDLVYGLAAVRAMGGGTVYVNRDENSHFGLPVCDEEMASILEFLESLEYVVSAKEWKKEDVDCDMDVFRTGRLDYNLLSDAQEMCLGVAHDHDKPWINPERVEPAREADIVVARSARYHGPFDWGELKPWIDRCVFVGSEKEHEDFVRATGMRVRRVRTPTWKALAGVIRGGKLFVGNQSMPYSLAEAMQLPRVLEVYGLCPNCDPRGLDGHLRLTQGVIRRYVEGDGAADESGVSRNSWMCKVFCVPKPTQRERIVFGIVIPNVDSAAGKLADEVRKAKGEVVVVEQGSSFEEMANLGAVMVTGQAICVVDPRWGISLVDAEMVVQQLADGRTGLVGACMSTKFRPHVSGPCFAVSRRAYEQLGLFNPAMRPGALNMLEMNLRFTRGRFGCKSASLLKWLKWSEAESPGDDAGNIAYVKKVYGVSI